MIEGKNVSLQYGSRSVLEKVSFAIEGGRITVFMGPSGAGKTSLLKCIANLCSHYGGHITCNGQDLKKMSHSERAATLGFVLQQFHLFPHLSVLQNCTLALIKVLNFTKCEAEKKANEHLSALGLTPFLQSFPSELSGGQQQRVAIARALALSPKILLFDEPTASLDPETKRSFENLLLALHAQGVTIAISSHDMPFISRIKDYVYFMENGALTESWDHSCEDLNCKPKIQEFLVPS